MKGKIIPGVLVLIGVAELVELNAYFRTHGDSVDKKPVTDLTVPRLIAAFEEKTVQVPHPFVGKVLRAAGFVRGMADVKRSCCVLENNECTLK